MKFKNLNRQYQTLKPAIDQAVREVLGSQDFILGEHVRKLEKELAAFTHRRHCITCASGSDALLLSLMALNIGPEDAVFLPDFTYIAAASAIQRTGAIPVFVDIDPVTFNMDPQDLECQIERIRKTTRFHPKAVIPTDLFGLPADYSRILPLAARHGLHVVSDAAQSMGASFKGQPAGSFGILAITSFFPAKPLGCYGDGGWPPVFAGCARTGAPPTANTCMCKPDSTAVWIHCRLPSCAASSGPMPRQNSGPCSRPPGAMPPA